MGVVVGHHDIDGGIRNFLLLAPGLAFEGIPHAAALGAAETNGRFAAVVVVHLMERTSAQRFGLIRHAGHTEVLELDRVTGGEGRSRQQAQDADQRQQQRRQAGPQMMSHFFHKKGAPLLEFPQKKTLQFSLKGLSWAGDLFEFRGGRVRPGCRRSCSSRSCRRPR